MTGNIEITNLENSTTCLQSNQSKMKKSKKNQVYLGLGSNLGDSKQTLHDAIESINLIESVGVAQRSSFYQTKAIGPEQPDYINACIHISCEICPQALLTELQKIELAFGRTRDIRWGARTLDIDILLFNDEIIETESLVVPHPRLHERLFVLVPLNDIAGEYIHPLTLKSIYQTMIENQSIANDNMVESL